MMRNRYQVAGMMSGTSLDGLDVACCEFEKGEDGWRYKILHACTFSYDEVWKRKLTSAHSLSGNELMELHLEYGRFTGKIAGEFVRANNFVPDFVASHGHTVFHEPARGITFQLGDGITLRQAAGFPVVYDFRRLDVELGGQGAPLVPIGDRLLFGDYRYCLNLGGIANISYEQGNKRLAYDICPVNMILNHLAAKLGMEYDADGKKASQGKIDPVLLDRLNALEFYKKEAPKSLGREWFESSFLPVINKAGLSTEDLLRTCVEHIALQLAEVIRQTGDEGNLLVTGGGAFNKFLIDRLRALLRLKVEVPDKTTVDFKEALIFAFLGVLRVRNEVNALASVTGAQKDSSGGIFLP